MKTKTTSDSSNPNNSSVANTTDEILLSRRTMLTAAAGLTAGATVLDARAGPAIAANGNGPNVMVILVDEMRFPKVFPHGITSAAQFLQTFMPNTYSLWQKGVKFTNHVSAASACSPSRGVLMTGLYSQQTWLGTTIISQPGSTHSDSPPLNPAYPTYGKLFQAAGYATPYIGKWHCSVPHQSDGQGALSLFGFQGFVNPDPTGYNLEGTYGALNDSGGPFYNDAFVASTAATWLNQQTKHSQPWCLTVGFQNPHDQEFFPAGTEYQTFTNMFASSDTNPDGYLQQSDWSTQPCADEVDWNSNILATPPSYGYPETPPNWESLKSLSAKPGMQTLNAQYCAMVWGGISDKAGSKQFSVAGFPNTKTYSGYAPPAHVGIGLAPFSYWRRSLDVYTKLLTIVDQSIGTVLRALPPDVVANTIIVLTSDHGDYAGAHGPVAGKTGSLYDEAIRVPLIVVDGTGRFAGDIHKERSQLTSHIDILPMLIGFAFHGEPNWMKTLQLQNLLPGDLVQLYGARYDMFPLLSSSRTLGREYALFATDEVLPPAYDFLHAPNKSGYQTATHIVGLITPHQKLGIYSNWQPGTLRINTAHQEGEYYDYATPNGVLELDNTYATDPKAAGLRDMLLNYYVPYELQATLPLSLQPAQLLSKELMVGFLALLEGSGE
jgi:uncharacterized sulfatase